MSVSMRAVFLGKIKCFLQVEKKIKCPGCLSRGSSLPAPETRVCLPATWTCGREGEFWVSVTQLEGGDDKLSPSKFAV